MTEFLLWFGIGLGASAVAFLFYVSVFGVRGVLLLAGLALLLAPADASACNRCGLFGRFCRFQTYKYYAPTYYQPVAYAQPSSVQTFNFVNSYPVAALGNSVYGYSLASQAYSLDAGQILDRSARFTELALQGANVASQAYHSTAQTALALNDADRRRQLAAVAIEALRAPTQPQTFTLTIEDGKPYISQSQHVPSGYQKQSPVQSPVQVPTQAPPQEPLRPLQDDVPPPPFGGLGMCSRCHDGRGGDGRPPGELVFDGPISEELYHRATAAVMSGRMPPNANLTMAQRGEIVSMLARSIGRLQ